jgi:hypothetical protein
MKTIRTIFTGLLMLLAGCSSSRIEDYEGGQPVMDIREFFNGNVEAWGVFIDRSGKADPTFYVAMKGSWQGNDGELEEHFDYSDGHKQERAWTIRFDDEHHFTATAHDAIGEAKGVQYGNAVNMRYVLAVTTKEGKTYNMSMDDWMYRVGEHTVMNRVQMSKFGFNIGELVLTFHKK